MEKKTFAEEVNAAFREAAAGPMAGVLAVADVPLVSVDFRCTDVSTTIDSSLTMVMGDDMVKGKCPAGHTRPRVGSGVTGWGWARLPVVLLPKALQALHSVPCQHCA